MLLKDADEALAQTRVADSVFVESSARNGPIAADRGFVVVLVYIGIETELLSVEFGSILAKMESRLYD